MLHVHVDVDEPRKKKRRTGAPSSPSPSSSLATRALSLATAHGPSPLSPPGLPHHTLLALPSDVFGQIALYLPIRERFPLRVAVSTAALSREPGSMKRLDSLLFHDQVVVDLSSTNITSTGMSFLYGARFRLQRLSLKGCLLLRDEAKELQVVATLMNLYALDLSETRIGNQALACLGSMALTRLKLQGCSLITDAGLRHLRGLPLILLNLHNCKEITDAGLAHLRGLPLTHLDLGRCFRITDAGLRYLCGLPLNVLNLHNCKEITDAGLAHLRGLPLTHLDLGR
jgi:hypothetical protein